MRVTRAQPLHRLVDDWRRRVEVRIAGTEHQHILARGVRMAGLPMQHPGIDAFGRDPARERRKPHCAFLAHSKASALISNITTWRPFAKLRHAFLSAERLPMRR